MRQWLMMGACALGVAACDTAAPPPVAAVATAADTASQFMLGVSLRIHDGGLLRADVMADTAYFFDDNTRLDLRGVQAVFYTSTGAKDGVMTSQRATYAMNTQSMEAMGNVVLVSLDGRRLTSPQLRFDRTINQISSDSAFQATGPDKNISGVGFTSDPGMNNLRIKASPQGVMSGVTLPGR